MDLFVPKPEDSTPLIGLTKLTFGHDPRSFPSIAHCSPLEEDHEPKTYATFISQSLHPVPKSSVPLLFHLSATIIWQPKPS